MEFDYEQTMLEIYESKWQEEQSKWEEEDNEEIEEIDEEDTTNLLIGSRPPE